MHVIGDIAHGHGLDSDPLCFCFNGNIIMLKVRFFKILMFPAETRGELFGSLKAQRVNGNAEQID